MKIPGCQTGLAILRLFMWIHYLHVACPRGHCTTVAKDKKFLGGRALKESARSS